MFANRLMIWAADLDDLNGTAIKSLGSGLTRPIQPVVFYDINNQTNDLP